MAFAELDVTVVITGEPDQEKGYLRNQSIRTASWQHHLVSVSPAFNGTLKSVLLAEDDIIIRKSQLWR